MDENRTTKKDINAQPIGTRRKGRPNLRWIDDLEKDLIVLRTKNWRTLAGRRGVVKGDEAIGRCKKVGQLLHTSRSRKRSDGNMNACCDLFADNKGVDPRNIHIVGHSLGAHISGVAGTQLPTLGRITGLDPASRFVFPKILYHRLNYTDATFVDIIHTSTFDNGKLNWFNVYQMNFINYISVVRTSLKISHLSLMPQDFLESSLNVSGGNGL
ncbi:hypothetical protein TNCV_1148431 [Trichonephila clavipes]|nr:hypothetical protein TNCV_1148431 [Trichonephila clavipes]